MADLKKDFLKYGEYQLDDFLADEFFIQWVKFPTPDNSHFWEKWIQENSDKKDMIREAAGLIRLVKKKEGPGLSNKEYVELFEGIIRSELVKPTESTRTKYWYSFFNFRQVAVLFLFLSLSGVYYYSFVSSDKNGSEIADVGEKMVVRNIPLGQKATLQLEDGTKIYLNSGSEFSFPENFGDSLRTVFLKGEAFFEVAEEKDRPFRVVTSQADIEVLGTSFNINFSSNHIAVALVTGKVKVNDRLGNRMVLKPKEILMIDSLGNFKKGGFDAMEILGWKDKYLVFNENSIEEVENKLENWYGVQVEIQGDFPINWAYSGMYQDESLDNVLLGIRQTSKIRYKLKEKEVQISFGG